MLARTGDAAAAATRRLFVLSYDLWEERFAVTTVGARRRHLPSHLAAAAAEAWCVEQLTVPLSALGTLGRASPFWIRLEYRVLDGDGAPATDAGFGLYAARLIDVLSRRRKAESSPSSQPIEAGPFRLPPR